MNGLGLDTANAAQGFEPIPAGTVCVLVMKIKPGNCGIDELCKRSSKGDSEGLDVEYVVQGEQVRQAQDLRFPFARRRHGGPRQGRRDHAFVVARDL